MPGSTRSSPTSPCVLYNDHGLNFFLDKMPTFAVGAAPEYRNADEGWGIPVVPPFKGELDLSWHLIESLVAEEFDLTTCQEMLVDHAFTLPMALLWPGQDAWPVTTVPVCINTVQFPLPSAARCWKLGQAIGRAIQSWDADKRVVVIGTGGLSHQLDGERAGFINKDFDLKFMDSLVADPTWATQYSITDLVELTGTQGVELLMWLATRGALGGHGEESARQLSHPDLEHRGRADGAGERRLMRPVNWRCGSSNRRGGAQASALRRRAPKARATTPKATSV